MKKRSSFSIPRKYGVRLKRIRTSQVAFASGSQHKKFWEIQGEGYLPSRTWTKQMELLFYVKKYCSYRKVMQCSKNILTTAQTILCVVLGQKKHIKVWALVDWCTRFLPQLWCCTKHKLLTPHSGGLRISFQTEFDYVLWWKQTSFLKHF